MNPYLRLGLQRNPFVAEDVIGVPDALWIDRGYSTAPLPQGRQLVQVLGVQGAGKSSHLKYWQNQIDGPYCCYPLGWGRLKMPPIKPIAYWDEADRIPLPLLALALAQAARIHATIVVGTHSDLQRIGRFVGLTMKTIDLSAFDAKSLMLWSRYRIEAVQLPDTSCKLTLSHEKAEEIAAIANGSWREAANYLHVWAAKSAKRKETVFFS